MLRCACRDQAKGATFFSAVEGETVRPMLDVSWAPFLGAFSVLFEEFHEGKVRTASFLPAVSVSVCFCQLFLSDF